jgi:hypothetical protein
MRWARYVARVGENNGAYRVLLRRPERKNFLEDLGLNGRLILKCISKSRMGHGLDRSGSGYRQVAGSVNAIINLRVL